MLPILAMASALKFLSHLGGVVCEATGTLNRKLALQVTAVVVLALLLLGAIEIGGLQAFAVAVVLSELVRHLLYILLMRRLLEITPAQLRQAYAAPILSAVIVACAIGAASQAIALANAPAVVTLAVQVATGALTLMILLWFGPLVSLRREVHERLRAAGVLDESALGGITDRLLGQGR